jgi:hypothetical protein
MSEEIDFEGLQQAESDVNVPDDPGPALAGKTPAVGSVRRGMGVPVLRDELKDMDF